MPALGLTAKFQWGCPDDVEEVRVRSVLFGSNPANDEAGV
jgi:hypothetical protein